MNRRRVRLDRPFDLRATLGPLRRGRHDPTTRFDGSGMWRATRTPDGPATTHVVAADGLVTMSAWGPGAQWCLDRLPRLLGEAGAGERPAAGFHPLVDDLSRRFPGLRVGRTEAVVEALVPSILEQKVIGIEAWRSYAALVRCLGEPAPGPPPAGEPAPGPPPAGEPAPGPPPAGPPPAGGAGLLLPPDPARLMRTPSWVFHRCGVERKRADTIRLAASYAARLEQTADMELPAAYARMKALPGIGPWTAAEVARVALGDVDAVSVGDYHLPNRVAWALAGEARADDARMLELLEPWRGRRALVVRLIELGAPAAPRFGPRLALHPIAAL